MTPQASEIPPVERARPMAVATAGDAACARIAWALSAAFLGAAIQVKDGLFDARAFYWLTAGIAVMLAPLMVRRWSDCGKLAWLGSGRFLILLLGALNAWQFWQFYRYRLPGSWHGPDADWVFRSLLGIAAGLFVVMFIIIWRHEGTEARRHEGQTSDNALPIQGAPQEKLVSRFTFHVSLFFLLLATFAVMGTWIIWLTPEPFMDVWHANTAGLERLAHGGNPFNAPYKDIYGSSAALGPSIVRDGKIHLGFPYPPLTAFMELPGHVLLGDYRYSNLAAMLGAAALIGYAGRRRGQAIGLLAGTFFLFTPRSLFVLESGWTEPTMALLLAAIVFAALRNSRWTPVLLGLFLVSKQYLALAAPCALLLLPWPLRIREVVRWGVIALAVGLAVSLPLILWDVPAFMRCNIEQIAKAPLRMDALSYLTLFAYAFGKAPPAWIGFAVSIAAVALVLWRCRRTPAGFAAAVAIVYVLFFALGKGAFCNYYYFIIACLCTALAGQSDPHLQPACSAR